MNNQIINHSGIQYPNRVSTANHIHDGHMEQPYQNIDSMNMLILIATPLITLITQVRHTIQQEDVTKFRAKIIEEIKLLENKLQQSNYSPRTIIATKYCLCNAIDEAVLGTPWGTQSIWVQGTLLSHFHRETWGGERFYIILEDMAKDPRNNIDFLEFAYFLLSLGYEGKFYGKNQIYREEIRNRVFQKIRLSRQKPDKALSHNWRDRNNNTTQTSTKGKIKKLGITTTVMIVVIAIFFNLKVHSQAEDLLGKLDAIANVSPVTSFSQVISRPEVSRK